MTYNRMKAKKIKNERCKFCGDDNAPLVKTECCHEWACCDTAYISRRGAGTCQVEHEYYSMCHFHFNEKHLGPWKECMECAEFFKSEYGSQFPGSRNEAIY